MGFSFVQVAKVPQYVLSKRYYGNKVSKVIAIHSVKCYKKLILRKNRYFRLLPVTTDTFMTQFLPHLTFQLKGSQFSFARTVLIISNVNAEILEIHPAEMISLQSDCPESDRVRL